MNKKAILPNLISISNLLLGFLAILLIFTDKPGLACWFIVIAAILDGLDGTIARLIKTSSPFGAQVDSLVDTVSFGVAPSVLIYKVALEQLGFLGMIFSFVPLLCGVLRLARFNTAKKKKANFTGMPITTSGIILASFYLYLTSPGNSIMTANIWFSLIPAVSLLMISPIPYRRMPVVQLNGSKNPGFSVAVLLSASAFVLWNPALAIFPLMVIYILTGPIEWMVSHARGLKERDEDNMLSAESTTKRNRRRPK